MTNEMPNAGRPIDGGAITVHVLRGIIEREGHPFRVSALERLLALALAVQRHPVSASYLSEFLYPERVQVPSSLKVYVHRLRRRIGDDVIARSRHGYALGAGVQTDLRLHAPWIADCSRRLESLGRDEHVRLEELARHLRADRPADLMQYDWYALLARRLKQQGQDIALGLARLAFGRGDDFETIRITHELIYEDGTDEAARELAIRAHLRAGEHGAALHEFNRYRDALRDELQLLPSPHLVNLIRTGEGLFAKISKQSTKPVFD